VPKDLADPERPRRCLIGALVLLLSVTACGSATQDARADEPPGLDPGDQELDGAWLLDSVELTIEDASSSDDGAPELAEALTKGVQEVVFDTTAVSAEFSTECRLVLGSYTFLADGTAGFTLPGRSTDPCPATDDQLAGAFMALLEQVDGWSQEGQLLVFEGPQAKVRLRRAG
jgi:hypothetical protein